MVDKRKLLVMVFGIVTVLVIVGIAVYYSQKPREEQRIQTPPTTPQPTAIPKAQEIPTLKSPLERLPSLNPIEKINPFKDLYKNPF